MNIFIDANVLIAVLQKEYPVYPFASRVMSLAGVNNHSVFTSPLCLAIAFYFLEKKHGTVWAGKIIQQVVQRLKITTCGAEETMKACSNKRVADFEDGLQYYSALAAGCNCIVTENIGDFHFANIHVYTSKDFMEQCILR